MSPLGTLLLGACWGMATFIGIGWASSQPYPYTDRRTAMVLLLMAVSFAELLNICTGA